MILAFSEAGTVAITVAAIAAIPTTIAAIGGFRGATAAREARDAIGTPNGQGNVVEMHEKSLAIQRQVQQQLTDLQGHVVEHGIALSAHDARIRNLGG